MTDESVLNIVVMVCVLGVAGISICARRRKQKQRWFSGVAAISVICLLIIGGAAFWYTHRPLPAPTRTSLFRGIEYERLVEDGPMIVHVVRIDLDTPELTFRITPASSSSSYDVDVRTTSEFLSEFKLQLAINGDFFDPWRDIGFWDYYPHSGDGVNTRGLSAAIGDVYTEGYTLKERYHTLYISETNEASFTAPDNGIFNAISGNIRLIQNGDPISITDVENEYLMKRHPRTAVGFDEAGKTLIIVVIDGRQPNYSEGATIPELIEVMLGFRVFEGINLDGGGSSTLVIEGEQGQAVVLNSPIHNRIPGRERPIANHLGVYTERLNQVEHE